MVTQLDFILFFREKVDIIFFKKNLKIKNTFLVIAQYF